MRESAGSGQRLEEIAGCEGLWGGEYNWREIRSKWNALGAFVWISRWLPCILCLHNRLIQESLLLAALAEWKRRLVPQ